jgi:DNA repair and recombination protein RAD54B
MASASIGGGAPMEGTPLRIGNYDVEVDREVTYDE